MQTKWPLLKGQLALKFGTLALLIFVFLLPFQPFFPPITSGIVAFWLVFVLSFSKPRLQGLNNRLFLWAAALYIWIVLGAIYSNNSREAGLDVTLKITLLLWPMGAAIWPFLFNVNRYLILKVFGTTTLISILSLIVIGVAKWQNSQLPISDFYKFTTAWQWIPNHYMALYTAFAILSFIYLGVKKHLAWKLAAPAILVLSIAIIFLSVRIQLLALPASLAAMLLIDRETGINRKKAIAIVAFGILLFFSGMLAFPASRARLAEIVDEAKSFNYMVNSKQTNHRVYLWKYGAEVVKKHPIIGTGTGAADDALQIELAACDAEFWNGHTTYRLVEKNYNYHNAFLQRTATNGIIGLVLFLALFVAPFFAFKKSINGLQGGFLVLCAISFFTESMLERQAGMLFFSFFYALLFVAPWAEISKSSGKNIA